MATENRGTALSSLMLPGHLGVVGKPSNILQRAMRDLGVGQGLDDVFQRMLLLSMVLGVPSSLSSGISLAENILFQRERWVKRINMTLVGSLGVTERAT